MDDRKMIEADLIEDMKRSADDMTYYIQAKEGRDIAMRSLQAQGFKINKKVECLFNISSLSIFGRTSSDSFFICAICRKGKHSRDGSIFC